MNYLDDRQEEIDHQNEKINESLAKLEECNVKLSRDPLNLEVASEKNAALKTLVESHRLLLVYYTMYLTISPNREEDSEGIGEKIAKIQEERLRYQREIIKFKESRAEYPNPSWNDWYLLAEILFESLKPKKEPLLAPYFNFEHEKAFVFIFSKIPEVDEICITLSKCNDIYIKEAEELERLNNKKKAAALYELAGDRYIDMYVVKKEFEVPLCSYDREIRAAYDLYGHSTKLKEGFGSPITAIGSPHLPRPSIFNWGDLFKFNSSHDFAPYAPGQSVFPDSYTAGNSQQKCRILVEKFPKFLSQFIYPLCWKSNDFCQYRRFEATELSDPTRIFISMDYSSENNSRIYEHYLKPILEGVGLTPILKKQEPGSQSYTKQICCSIFQSRFGLVILDEQNPNVILELGMMLAQGRKTMILLNENYCNAKDKPSMLDDYDLVVYKNASEFVGRIYQFLENFFELPLVKQIEFTREELHELNELISTKIQEKPKKTEVIVQSKLKGAKRRKPIPKKLHL